MKSLDYIYLNIEAQNVHFERGALDISLPQPLNDGEFNTCIVLKAKKVPVTVDGVTDLYIGSKVLDYNRQYLSDLFEGINITLDLTGDELTDINELLIKYNLDIDPDEFTITYNERGDGCTISAKEENYIFTGSVEIADYKDLDSLPLEPFSITATAEEVESEAEKDNSEV